jgi:general secretion pathway protein D
MTTRQFINIKMLLLTLCTVLTLQPFFVFGQEKLTMNMRNADIRALIQWIADSTNKNIIVHKEVKGNVTVLSPEPLTTDEAYQVFLSVLQVHGYAAIETNEAIKIVPISLASRSALPYAGTSSSDMVVSILKIKHIPVTKLADTLRPLLSREAVLVPYSPSNALVIADHANNIKTAESLIKKLDIVGESKIEIVSLKHADAMTILKSLQTLLPSSSGDSSANSFNLAADERSNSLLLAGDSSQRNQFRTLINKLDTPLNGQGNTQVVYLHYVDASEIAPILKSLAKNIQQTEKEGANGISVEASETANALVINAPPTMLRTLKRVISQLDIRRAQVLVEAIIVEVSGDISNDLGVSWLTDPDKDVISAVNTLGNLPLAEPNLTSSNSPLSPGRGFTFGYFNNGDLQAALRALNANQNTNVLSTPTIVAIDNEEASLLVGQNVPFITGQSTSSSSSTLDPFTTIERQDIGISLVVTPRINQGDSITLQIEQKTENIAPSVSVAADIITNKREIITTALIKDGQVLVLGGLISEDETEVQEKVPFLGSLPLIGKLFSSTGITHSKKNLMVFIHPTILKDDAQMDQITQQRYKFMRDLQQQVKKGEWKVDSKDKAVLEEFDRISPASP